MKKLICLIICFFALIQVFTQVMSNEKYDFGLQSGYGVGFVQDTSINGDLHFFGIAGDTSARPWPGRLFIANRQNNGNLSYQLGAKSQYYWINAVSKNNGSYWMAGHYFDTTVSMTKGMLLKFSLQMDTLLQVRYQVQDLNNGVYKSFHALEGNKLYYFYEKDSVVQNQSTKQTLVLALRDTLGNLKWLSKKYYPQWSSRGFSIGICNHNILCAGGLHKKNTGNQANQYDFRSLILLYDSTGTLLKEYLSPIGEDIGYARCVLSTQDGGYVYCGQKIWLVVLPGSVYATTLTHGYVCKLNANFEKVWEREVRNIDTAYVSLFTKMIELADGSFVCVGEDQGYVNNGLHNKGWMVKLSKDGEIIWQRHHYILDQGIADNHTFYDVKQMQDGGFACVGLADNVNGPYPLLNYAWLIRTDSFGCLVPGCQTVGITDNPSLANSFKLYPNPAADRIYLYWHNPQPQNHVFTVTDLAGGQLVPPTHLENSTTYEIPLAGWSKGIYFLQVQDEKGNIHVEKFIKE